MAFCTRDNTLCSGDVIDSGDCDASNVGSVEPPHAFSGGWKGGNGIGQKCLSALFCIA